MFPGAHAGAISGGAKRRGRLGFTAGAMRPAITTKVVAVPCTALIAYKRLFAVWYASTLAWANLLYSWPAGQCLAFATAMLWEKLLLVAVLCQRCGAEVPLARASAASGLRR